MQLQWHGKELIDTSAQSTSSTSQRVVARMTNNSLEYAGHNYELNIQRIPRLRVYSSLGAAATGFSTTQVEIQAAGTYYQATKRGHRRALLAAGVACGQIDLRTKQGQFPDSMPETAQVWVMVVCYIVDFNLQLRY
ncbi:MAG: hypothetical protein Q3976_04105 [Corynebacterium sp.]|nr:hypothetical protein [Corynebacterium sp.]